MNEQETSADIIAEMRMFKCRNLETGELELCNAIGNYFADRLEAVLKREKAAIEADALAVGGVVAATAEKSSVVGNAAKLREALEATLDLFWDIHIANRSPQSNQAYAVIKQIKAALAAPPRNCDKVKDHSDAIGKFEKWMDFSPKTADEQDAFFKEHWFEFATWLIDMNESEADDER